MSYALRNTIVLLVALTLIAGSGWSYLYFVQASNIESLITELETKNSEMSRKETIASRYEPALTNYENAVYFFDNYDKALYLSSNEDRVYDFINRLNTGSSYVNFTFAFADSAVQGQHGIIRMSITGDGYYRNFINLIRKIELSKPLNKVRAFNVSPLTGIEDYGKVNFNFRLESYYDRASLLEGDPFEINNNASLASLYNPFYPLIREIEPNTENLTNVESSRLLAISPERIFLIDQTGIMKQLRVGDRVYLGRLISISVRDRSATFELNKGGIIERVTLEVQQ